MQILNHNEQWAREEIVGMMTQANDPEKKVTAEDVLMIKTALEKLDAILYKSWSKDLTLTELLNVLNQVVEDLTDEQ
jgi:hypothetical protein